MLNLKNPGRLVTKTANLSFWMALISCTSISLLPISSQASANNPQTDIANPISPGKIDYSKSKLLAQIESGETVTQEKVLKVGVLAKRGEANTIQQWQSLIDYLSETIPGYKFKLLPLNFDDIDQAAKNQDLDFMVTNSGMYVNFEARYGVKRIATLKNLRLGKPYTIFGGVIFTLANRDDINKLKDFKGKTFIAVDQASLGGWQMAWGVFDEQGINPQKHFKDLSFGGTHDDVVMAVLNGEVDGGTVRTDTLERMAREGKINIQDFKIINQQQDSTGKFPFVHSTPLYPESPFAASNRVPVEVSEEVAKALLNLPPDHPAAVAAKSEGWTVPLNYQPVHELFIDLTVPPYDEIGQITFKDFLWYWVAIAVGLVALAGFLIYNQYLQQRLKNDESLREFNELLEKSAQEQREQREALESAVVAIVESLEPASEGDLTVRAELVEGDVGIIADLFNVIVEKLRDIAVQTKTSASQANFSLGENEVSIRELAEQSIAEVEQIKQTLSFVADMSRSIQEVAENAEKTSAISNDAFTTAQEGNAAMELTVQSIQALRNTVGDTAKKIKRLGESAQQVSQVVSLIDEIALKTNLLAINASVEAARAGELGQGFTAVAEQVGALAEQSAKATQEIAQLIQGIQRETQEVVSAMEVGTTQVVNSTHLVEDTKEKLQKVLEKSQDIDRLMRSISQATVSQAQTSEVVTETMEKVTQASQERSAYSKEIAEAIQKTSNLVEELQLSVAQFKVAETESKTEATVV